MLSNENWFNIELMELHGFSWKFYNLSFQKYLEDVIMNGNLVN
jgi:hypothetical protein